MAADVARFLLRRHFHADARLDGDLLSFKNANRQTKASMPKVGNMTTTSDSNSMRGLTLSPVPGSAGKEIPDHNSLGRLQVMSAETTPAVA